MTEGLEQGAVLVLDEIVRRAARAHASDIHLEPKRDRLVVRFRVDGEMVEEQSVPLDIAPEVLSRIKVLARMDIAERRLPQDGQLTLSPDGAATHLRASSFPSALGEKIVLRLLSGQSLIAFDRLGLDATTQAISRLVPTPGSTTGGGGLSSRRGRSARMPASSARAGASPWSIDRRSTPDAVATRITLPRGAPSTCNGTQATARMRSARSMRGGT